MYVIRNNDPSKLQNGSMKSENKKVDNNKCRHHLRKKNNYALLNEND